MSIHYPILMMTMKKIQNKIIKKFKIIIKNAKITSNQPSYFNDDHEKLKNEHQLTI